MIGGAFVVNSTSSLPLRAEVYPVQLVDYCPSVAVRFQGASAALGSAASGSGLVDLAAWDADWPDADKSLHWFPLQRGWAAGVHPSVRKWDWVPFAFLCLSVLSQGQAGSCLSPTAYIRYNIA